MNVDMYNFLLGGIMQNYTTLVNQKGMENLDEIEKKIILEGYIRFTLDLSRNIDSAPFDKNDFLGINREDFLEFIDIAQEKAKEEIPVLKVIKNILVKE